jgi:hypothetical protein
MGNIAWEAPAEIAAREPSGAGWRPTEGGDGLRCASLDAFSAERDSTGPSQSAASWRAKGGDLLQIKRSYEVLRLFAETCWEALFPRP